MSDIKQFIQDEFTTVTKQGSCLHITEELYHGVFPTSLDSDDFTVNAKEFVKALNKFSTPTIVVSNESVTIKEGRRRVSIARLADAEIVALDEPDWQTIDTTKLNEVGKFIGQESYAGMYLLDNYAVCTDGQTLAFTENTLGIAQLTASKFFVTGLSKKPSHVAHAQDALWLKFTNGGIVRYALSGAVPPNELVTYLDESVYDPCLSSGVTELLEAADYGDINISGGVVETYGSSDVVKYMASVDEFEDVQDTILSDVFVKKAVKSTSTITIKGDALYIKDTIFKIVATKAEV